MPQQLPQPCRQLRRRSNVVWCVATQRGCKPTPDGGLPGWHLTSLVRASCPPAPTPNPTHPGTPPLPARAPGWHLVSACVRKGSLIVHLDLAYIPPPSRHPSPSPSPSGPALPPPSPTPAGARACGVSEPGRGRAVGLRSRADPNQSPHPADILDDFLSGLGPRVRC